MTDTANDLDQFADGLMAARMAKIDLDVGDAQTPRLLTTKDIEDLRNTKRTPDADALQSHSPRLYAAFKVFRRTGSLTAAVEGLSFRTRGQRRIYQLTRRTIAYLILIVLTAIACLVLFWFRLRPELEMIRTDIILTSSVELPNHYDGLIVLACLVVLVVILLILTRQLFGKTNLFTRFSGGQEYLDLGQQALLWSITQRLVEAGQPVPESTSIAGQLLGLDTEKLSLPGGFACESIEQIESTRSMYEMLSRQKIESVSNAFPLTAVVTVGGGCALICVLATFYPIVRLLDDLTKGALS